MVESPQPGSALGRGTRGGAGGAKSVGLAPALHATAAGAHAAPAAGGVLAGVDEQPAAPSVVARALPDPREPVGHGQLDRGAGDRPLDLLQPVVVGPVPAEPVRRRADGPVVQRVQVGVPDQVQRSGRRGLAARELGECLVDRLPEPPGGQVDRDGGVRVGVRGRDQTAPLPGGQKPRVGGPGRQRPVVGNVVVRLRPRRGPPGADAPSPPSAWWCRSSRAWSPVTCAVRRPSWASPSQPPRWWRCFSDRSPAASPSGSAPG